ncbi:hypothetical protein TXYLGN1_12520 [Tepidimicrobium xylanilyticum]|nr:hypothetical protein EN5CB1_25230 [Tepidimicrobium xylanilyticum]
MTKNEIILFYILGTIIFFWTMYRFIIFPQYMKLQALILQRKDYEEKISQINAILKKEDNIEKEGKKLYEEKIALTSKYFPYIDQYEIIVLLSDLFDNENMEFFDINFTTPKEEYIDDFSFHTIDVHIPFRAPYNGLIEILRKIKECPKKLLVTDLLIDSVDSQVLAGHLSMKIYSLIEYNPIYDSKTNLEYASNVVEENPFYPLQELSSPEDEVIYEDEVSLEDETDLQDKVDNHHMEILEDFEDDNYYFIPSSKYVNGGVYKSTNSISNEHSIRFEYNILALESENRAYLDLSNRNIILKYPPDTVGIWVYSFEYSPATLGFRMKGQAGEFVDLELSRGISWKGWNYIEVKFPSDLALYPLQLDKLYIELANNREDYGVLLLDKVEANYTKRTNGFDENNESFSIYVVEKDDTLDEISMKFYGTAKKKDIIIKRNEIKSDKDIKEGRILVIPK